MAKIRLRTVKEALVYIKSLQQICKRQRQTIDRLQREVTASKVGAKLPPGFDNLFKR